MRQQASRPPTHWDGLGTDAARYAAHAHAWHICTRQKHRHIVHISLTPAFNRKQICYTHYTPTDAHIRLPTISPPIRHQTTAWGFLATAFDLDKWVSFGHTFLPSPSIRELPFVPITDYPSLSGGHQLGWLGHSQDSIFPLQLEYVHFCCLLRCWLILRTFDHNSFVFCLMCHIFSIHYSLTTATVNILTFDFYGFTVLGPIHQETTFLVCFYLLSIFLLS